MSMYTTENYAWGLVAYGLGALMLVPLLWWITRWLPWQPMRAIIRSLLLAVLLTPEYAYSGMPYLAPAWVVAVFNTVNSTGEVAVGRLTALFFITAISILGLFYVKSIVTRYLPARPHLE